MRFFFVTSIIATLIYIYIGLYVLSIDIRSKLHRSFFCVVLAFAWWSFCTIFVNITTDPHEVAFWFRLGFIGEVINSPIILRFVLILTRFDQQIKHRTYLYMATWVMPLFLTYINFTYNAIYTDYPYGFWFIVANICIFIVNVSSVSLLFLWGKHSKLNKIKRQKSIIASNGVITIIVCTISNFTFWYYRLPSQAATFVLIWIISVWYAIIRYRFLSITPELISTQIFQSIDDIIIFIDPDEKVALINNYAKAFLAHPGHVQNRHIADLIDEYSSIKKSIASMLSGQKNSFSFYLNFMQNRGSKILVHTNFSLVKDSFHDILGILIVGKRNKEISYLKEMYSLSDRELEVIQHIAAGIIYKKIAKKLQITERTIKAHVNSVYNKIGISSRTQLLHLLKSFTSEPVHKPGNYTLLRKEIDV